MHAKTKWGRKAAVKGKGKVPRPPKLGEILRVQKSTPVSSWKEGKKEPSVSSHLLNGLSRAERGKN